MIHEVPPHPYPAQSVTPIHVNTYTHTHACAPTASVNIDNGLHAMNRQVKPGGHLRDRNRANGVAEECACAHLKKKKKHSRLHGNKDGEVLKTLHPGTHFHIDPFLESANAVDVWTYSKNTIEALRFPVGSSGSEVT